MGLGRGQVEAESSISVKLVFQKFHSNCEEGEGMVRSQFALAQCSACGLLDPPPRPLGDKMVEERRRSSEEPFFLRRRS